MGDWIWVLITALITFVGLFAINFAPQEEPNTLFLEFPSHAESTVDSEAQAIKEAIKEQIWTSPPDRDAPSAMKSQAESIGTLVGMLNPRENETSGTSSWLARIDPAVWGAVVLTAIMLFVLKLFQFLRRPSQTTSLKTTAENASS